MNPIIPESFRALIALPSVPVLSTTRHDGTPHAVPIWYDFDAELVAINTATHTVKYRNLMQRPYAALTFVDPADSDRYLSLQMQVYDVSDPDAGLIHLNNLAQRYMGVAEYPYRQVRDLYVRFRFRILRVSSLG